MAPSSDDTLILRTNFPIPEMPRPYSSLVRVELGALTHVGRVRSNNEDSYLVFTTGRTWERLLTSLPEGTIPERFNEVGYVMAVADGMGGTGGGEVASAMALRAAVAAILNSPNWALKLDHPASRDEAKDQAMARAAGYFRQAQDAISRLAQAGPGMERMGTTLTASYSFGRDLFIMHVGDSRAYLFRGGRLSCLTRDHTIAQELVEAGEMSPQEASRHRLSHVLTRALSAQGSDVDTEIDHCQLADGDVVLLCSDGLTGMISDDEVRAILARGLPAQQACQALVNAALQAGGRDNVTVVMGRYSLPTEAGG